ncbi:Metallo-dependent phosphatase-like protein [Umbelopsis sp. AD052]|nr:Metallo-dependent phosphatase-like protein [Umbelopsis sp. AD052]
MLLAIKYLLLLASVVLPATCQDPIRIVAVADLHGDYDNSLSVLQMADIVNDKAQWIGGNNTIFVQTGDVVDRGADTIRLYDMMQRLRNEAREAGSQAIPLLGNHEVMNLVGDWRYVYPEDVETFGSFEARVKAFEVDGFIGRYLTQLNMTAIVNRTVFCHGGIHPAFIDSRTGLDWINAYVHEHLPEYMESKGKYGDDQGVFGGHGPTWYRGYALGPEDEECPLLETALEMLGADRMVMGHTVQRDGKVHSRCDGKAILIDVGISKAYGRHRAALEIIGDKVVAINNGKRTEIKTTGKKWPSKLATLREEL